MMYVTACFSGSSPSHSRNIEWLRTYHLNSTAHHERCVLRHSQHHQQCITNLKASWMSSDQGKGCQMLPHMKVVPSPGPIPESIVHDLEVQDYFGVIYYSDEIETDRIRYNHESGRNNS